MRIQCTLRLALAVFIPVLQLAHFGSRNVVILCHATIETLRRNINSAAMSKQPKKHFPKTNKQRCAL